MTAIIIPPSSSAVHTFSTDAPRIAALWREQYRIARRDDGPVTAILTATLSTAETWGKIR